MRSLLVKVLKATGLYTPVKDAYSDLMYGRAYDSSTTKHSSSYLGPRSSVTGSHLEAHARVGAYACVIDSMIAESAHVAPYAYVSGSTIGTYSSIGKGSVVYASKMGKYCAVSWYCIIGARNQPTNIIANCEYISLWNSPLQEPGKRLSVGNDVWIGANSIILPDLIIGDGAVIGAGAVVSKDVPPYAVVVGVPARILKYRFPPAVIEELLELAWWDWDVERIRMSAPVLATEFNESSLPLLGETMSDTSA